MNQQQQAEKMSQVYARAWTDDAYRQSLLADPASALRAQGVELPANVEVIAVENSDKVFNLVLPARQPEGELSDDQLEDVSGGIVGMALIVSFLGVVGAATGAIGAGGMAAGFGIAKAASRRK
jgi:hypothetical protein